MWKGLVSHPHVSDKWTPLAHTLDFPKIPQTSSIWPLHPLYLLLIGPRPGTTLASLSSHCGLSWAPPSPGKWQPSAQNSVVHVGWSCTGHKQWLTLHLQGGPRASTSGRQLKAMLDYKPTPPQATHSRSKLNRHQSPTEVGPAPWSYTTPPPLQPQPLLAAAQPGGQSLPVTLTAIKAQLQQDCSPSPHRGCAWMTGEAVPLCPTGHLLHKSTLSSLGM